MGQQEHADGQPRELTIRVEKSPQARSIHADGVWGGVTPTGQIIMGIWTQFNTYPEHLTYDVTPEGSLENERRSPTDSLLTRQIEAEIIMSVDLARSMRDWLNDKIRDFERGREP